MDIYSSCGVYTNNEERTIWPANGKKFHQSEISLMKLIGVICVCVVPQSEEPEMEALETVWFEGV